MCLAIPARITSLDENTFQGTVEILGVTREASMMLTPHVGIGDYVLVHAGFAIEVIDEQSAQETLDLIAEFPELAPEELAAEGKISGVGANATA